jgi:hypothetical protein
VYSAGLLATKGEILGYMKLVFFAVALFGLFVASASAFDGEIQGRVLHSQGGPVAGATVIVSTNHEALRAKVVTAADGSFAIPNLEPGAYTVTVSIANGQQMQQEVIVGDDVATARADFRFTAEGAEGVAGLEERNPNIFIYRIDLNDLRNLLTLFRGPNPLKLNF